MAKFLDGYTVTLENKSEIIIIGVYKNYRDARRKAKELFDENMFKENRVYINYVSEKSTHKYKVEKAKRKTWYNDNIVTKQIR
jgi:acetyl-CoA carboxylase beta subunit